MNSLEMKLMREAAADAGLQAVLAQRADGKIAWYDTQLDQPSPFPAVVTLRVSYPRTESFTQRFSTNFARMQFTIWANTGEQARAVEVALLAFFDSFNASAIPGMTFAPNCILNSRAGMYAQTQPPKYLLMIDVRIFHDETVS